MLGVQTLINGQLAVTDPPSCAALMRWRPPSRSACSACAARRLGRGRDAENAAKVRTLGQVEILIAFAIPHLASANATRAVSSRRAPSWSPGSSQSPLLG